MYEAHAIVITDFELCTLIAKSTKPCCTKAKLGYLSKIDVDIDCVNRKRKIDKLKIPLEANNETVI